MDLQPTTQAAPTSNDPVYAPVDATVSPLISPYQSNDDPHVSAAVPSSAMPESVAADSPIPPVIPLVHSPESTVLTESTMPNSPAQPVRPLPQQIVEQPAPVVEAVVADSATPTTDKKSTIMSMALLVIVFVILFAIVGGLGYWFGLQHG